MPQDDADCVETLDSGPPWNLSLTIERIGSDLMCRLHGGSQHVGATALGWWDGPTTRVSHLAAGRHKEGPLAAFVAEQLCRATRATVTCIAGIHYDGLEASQIKAICEEVHTLSTRAAECVTDRTVSRTSWLQRRTARRACCFASLATGCERPTRSSRM